MPNKRFPLINNQNEVMQAIFDVPYLQLGIIYIMKLRSMSEFSRITVTASKAIYVKFERFFSQILYFGSCDHNHCITLTIPLRYRSSGYVHNKFTDPLASPFATLVFRESSISGPFCLSENASLSQSRLFKCTNYHNTYNSIASFTKISYQPIGAGRKDCYIIGHHAISWPHSL